MSPRVDNLELVPDGPPPHRGARWCPRCRQWMEARGYSRCILCATALVRPALPVTAKPGELRPGIAPQFTDPRDTRLTRKDR